MNCIIFLLLRFFSLDFSLQDFNMTIIKHFKIYKNIFFFIIKDIYIFSFTVDFFLSNFSLAKFYRDMFTVYSILRGSIINAYIKFSE